MDGRIDTTDGRSLRTRLIDARDLDDVETRAGFRLAEVWGRYDFAMGRRRQAASPSYEAGRGRGSLRTRLTDACDLDDVETRAGFRLAEVWGRYDFAMGRDEKSLRNVTRPPRRRLWMGALTPRTDEASGRV